MYKKLFSMFMEIFPNFDQVDEALKLQQPGFMDLNLDILLEHEEYTLVALSHYYKHHSGDMIPDPDMELAIYPAQMELEALSFQTLYGYQQVYESFPDRTTVDEGVKKELNEFLRFWLKNLKDQGFRQG